MRCLSMFSVLRTADGRTDRSTEKEWMWSAAKCIFTVKQGPPENIYISPSAYILNTSIAFPCRHTYVFSQDRRRFITSCSFQRHHTPCPASSCLKKSGLVLARMVLRNKLCEATCEGDPKHYRSYNTDSTVRPAGWLDFKSRTSGEELHKSKPYARCETRDKILG